MLASRWLVLSAIASVSLLGCGSASTPPADSGAEAPDFDAIAPADLPRPTDALDASAPCTATSCGVGLTCCPLTGRCFDPNCRSCCGADDASVPSDVAAPPADGSCATNADCPTTAYCAGDTCGTPGRCVPRPTGCTMVRAPVCGCDGVTQVNACAAAAAGARVAASGECTAARDASIDLYADASADAPTTGACGGVLCSVGMTCCDRPGSPAFGTCYDPDCTTCCAPVAGTDGGVTPPPDAPGACLINADCPLAGTFCASATCGTRGMCAPRPTSCASVVDPVCGCDGRTYANPCEASSTGVRAAARGPCMPPDAGAPPDAPRSPCETVRCTVGYVCCDTPMSPSFGTCYDPRCTTCCR